MRGFAVKPPRTAREWEEGGGAMTRKLTKEGQISYRSTKEIVKALDLVAARVAVDLEGPLGRKMATGHVVNAVCLWLVRLPDDELSGVMRPLLKALERYLDETDPLKPAKTSGAPPKPPQSDPKNPHPKAKNRQA